MEKWISIYVQRPHEGQYVKSRISGEDGYVGCCQYVNGYFETYVDYRNRIEIIRWKHDEWTPITPSPTAETPQNTGGNQGEGIGE